MFDPVELRGLKCEVSGTQFRFTAAEPDLHSYTWATLKGPTETWDFGKDQTVEAKFTNQGATSIETMFWAVGNRGWSAVGDFAKLEPGETRNFAINLRDSYPDGTPKVDPHTIKQLQVMFRGAAPDLDIAVSGIETKGEAPPFVSPPTRVTIPDWETASPAPVRRVRFQLPEDKDSDIYHILYLPKTWKKGGTYPVIVEFPGNIFFNVKCYSTGRPEQCAIGYGMTKGEDAIILSLPFIDRNLGTIIEDGFGNADDTTAYAMSAVKTAIRDFGGDRNNLFLTGFSRGSIACGYIGLRNEKIASLWKGIHGCQHYDGSKWKQSNMADAVVRAYRFQGKAIFQTDNSQEVYQPVVDATSPEVKWTWEKSGLGFHATAMFLDDRPSTQKLRQWYRDLLLIER